MNVHLFLGDDVEKYPRKSSSADNDEAVLRYRIQHVSPQSDETPLDE